MANIKPSACWYANSTKARRRCSDRLAPARTARPDGRRTTGSPRRSSSPGRRQGTAMTMANARLRRKPPVGATQAPVLKAGVRLVALATAAAPLVYAEATLDFEHRSTERKLFSVPLTACGDWSRARARRPPAPRCSCGSRATVATAVLLRPRKSTRRPALGRHRPPGSWSESTSASGPSTTRATSGSPDQAAIRLAISRAARNPLSIAPSMYVGQRRAVSDPANTMRPSGADSARSSRVI